MAEKLLLDSVDLAREVAVELAEDAASVGAHRGSVEIEERLVAHQFTAELPGYRGWVWEVVLSRAPRGKEAAVCEAHLVPADDALLAPAWVPWAERVRPGDLDSHMVLPYQKDDPRIVPGFEITDDADADAVAIWELGLGRERVLGVTGRDSAAERWYKGSHGPAAVAEACATCAFLIPVAGSMRGMFGVCANEWSPADGAVVSLDHGCGAHSESDLEKQSSRWPADAPVVDTISNEELDVSEPTDDAPAAESTDADAPHGDSAEPAADAPADVEAVAVREDAPAADAEERPADKSAE